MIVNKAVSYLGVKKGSAKHKEIVDTYNSHKPLARGYALKYTDAWCSGFVSAMSIACQLTDIIPTEVGCPKHIDLFKKIGAWQESDAYIPKPGDIMFYDWDDSGNGDNTGGADHVGIVTKVEADQITVIEGNKGASSVVGYRTVKVNGLYIRGYGVPNYASKATVVEDTTKKEATAMVELRVLCKGMTGNDVRQAMLALKDRGYYNGYIPKSDKEFGPKMYAATVAFQKAEKITADGIIGKDTWSHLLEK
jgi:hypothetical protein